MAPATAEGVLQLQDMSYRNERVEDGGSPDSSGVHAGGVDSEGQTPAKRPKPCVKRESMQIGESNKLTITTRNLVNGSR